MSNHTFPIVLILDNIRSLHNVGSIFRVADGAGIKKIYLTGITGYPKKDDDDRKPWEIESVTKKIHKTALGAETSVDWSYVESASEVLNIVKQEGYYLLSLERTEKSSPMYTTDFKYPVALVVGHERKGVSDEILEASNKVVHIPMFGEKESLNVSSACAVAVYEIVRRLSFV